MDDDRLNADEGDSNGVDAKSVTVDTTKDADMDGLEGVNKDGDDVIVYVTRWDVRSIILGPFVLGGESVVVVDATSEEVSED